MKASPLLAVAPVLRRQFGVFTVAQARDVGIPARLLSELSRKGELERLYRGVYASVLHPDGPDRRWMAARLAGGGTPRAAARRGSGLPKPAVNHRVVDASGKVRELDLAWPDWGVCVEIDLHPSHQGTIGRHLDGRRQNDLVTEWTILRFDDLDLQFEPASSVVGVIHRTLAHAGAPV